MGGVVSTQVRTGNRRNSTPIQEAREHVELRQTRRRRSRAHSVPLISTAFKRNTIPNSFVFNDIRYRDPDLLLPESIAGKLVGRLEKWDPEDSDWNFGLESELMAAAKGPGLTYNGLLRQLELVSYTMQLRNSMGTIHEKLIQMKNEQESGELKTKNSDPVNRIQSRRRSSLVAIFKDLVPAPPGNVASSKTESNVFEEMNSSQEDRAARKRYCRYVEALDAVVSENELKSGKFKELQLTESVHFLKGLAEEKAQSSKKNRK